MNGHTNFSTRISRMKTNLLNTCDEIQEPTLQDVDPRQDEWIDPFIVNFVRQVLVNGRNKGKLLEGKNCMYSLTGS